MFLNMLKTRAKFWWLCIFFSFFQITSPKSPAYAGSSLVACEENPDCYALIKPAVSTSDPSPSYSPPTASGGDDSSPSPAPSPDPSSSPPDNSGGNHPSDDDMWRELDRLNNPAPEVSQEAQAIANGHAWNDHRLEFPEVHSQDEFAELIDGVMNNASEEKQLDNGRTAYWDDQSGTVVITDPGDADGGTAFRPKNGKDYFDNELK